MFLSPICTELSKLGIPAKLEDLCDITIAGRKIAGNAQAQKFGAVIVHGSFLINADLKLINQCLYQPKEIPKYRNNRTHEQFLCNLSEFGVSKQQLIELFKNLELNVRDAQITNYELRITN